MIYLICLFFQMFLLVCQLGELINLIILRLNCLQWLHLGKVSRIQKSHLLFYDKNPNFTFCLPRLLFLLSKVYLLFFLKIFILDITLFTGQSLCGLKLKRKKLKIDMIWELPLSKSLLKICCKFITFWSLNLHLSSHF